MNDPLKKFVQQHRETFDQLEPPTEVLQRLRMQLKPRPLGVTLTRQLPGLGWYWYARWLVAASLLIGLVFTYVVFDDGLTERLDEPGMIDLSEVAATVDVSAQKQYKVGEPSGKLHVNLNGVRIEGYRGDEVIFSSQGVPEAEDGQAKEPQALGSPAFIDNTGMGINVAQKGNDIEVNAVENRSRGDVLYIRVPNTVDLVFDNNKSVFADTVLIKNMKGEIEVSSSYNDIVLENNSGPMNIKNLYKDIEVSFTRDIKGPISIVSVYGHVDVAMPASAKANLTMGTGYGKLYAAGDFHVAMMSKEAEAPDKATEIGAEAAKRHAATWNLMPGMEIAVPPPSGNGVSAAYAFAGVGENIEGTINGGGVDLILKSTYKNVYLRTP